MYAGIEQSTGLSVITTGVGNRDNRYTHQDVLDYLSKMVFFRHLYCDGMGMCTCLSAIAGHFADRRIPVVADWRNHLYRGWSAVCTKDSIFKQNS